MLTTARILAFSSLRGLQLLKEARTLEVARFVREQVMLPALGITPPLTEWGAKEVAIDALHHLVYATATGVAYSLLDR